MESDQASALANPNLAVLAAVQRRDQFVRPVWNFSCRQDPRRLAEGIDSCQSPATRPQSAMPIDRQGFDARPNGDGYAFSASVGSPPQESLIRSQPEVPPRIFHQGMHSNVTDAIQWREPWDC